MTNSILALMTQIETEAQAIQDSYEREIQDYARERQLELEEVKQQCDQEIQKCLEQEEAALAKELKVQTTHLTDTLTKNGAQVQAILKQKKRTLASQIVDKVVEKYGH
ncbi:hypothetical protein [Streptococcus halichoeri]|uniref:hypothetical protein n=1 Tax=Streptococcus halichoeri TaxID=254785 RepID=UPI00135B4F24|nr:hypothetical protein [Streptococcus halichoeri]